MQTRCDIAAKQGNIPSRLDSTTLLQFSPSSPITLTIALEKMILDPQRLIERFFAWLQARRDALNHPIERAFSEKGAAVPISTAQWADDSMHRRPVAVVGPALCHDRQSPRFVHIFSGMLYARIKSPRFTT